MKLRKNIFVLVASASMTLSASAAHSESNKDESPDFKIKNIRGMFEYGSGSCITPAVLSYDDRAALVMSFAEAIVKMKQARDGYLTAALQVKGKNLEAEFGDALYEMKKASKTYACATEIMLPFLKSKSEDITVVAMSLSMNTVRLSGESNRQLRSALADISKMAKLKSEYVKMSAEESSDSRLAIDEAYKMVPNLLAIVTHIAVEPAKDQKSIQLVITEQQRKDTIKSLRSGYPKAKPGKESHHALEFSAEKMIEFLNQKWKTKTAP
ncbi:MAG: hypothetical protein EOP05_00505 [Proteobacteria bacterium]|nr:MAG: hypothetical protein EOP05_00505 [Pseudomonadota bacterium]